MCISVTWRLWNRINGPETRFDLCDLFAHQNLDAYYALSKTPSKTALLRPQASSTSMNANPGINDPLSKHANSGEKRKRDGEQVQPPAENAGLTGSVTRQRIVEILSNTANGCLSELGYYPGMAGKLKELEAQNLKWRDENVKLYQDNQRLTQMIQNLNANVALSGIPESDKVAQLLHLQNEFRKLQAENEHIRKLLQSLPQEHDNLIAKYNRLVHVHQAIIQENHHLKNHIHGLTGQQYLPPQHPQQISHPQISTNPNVLLQRVDQHPQLQAQVQHAPSSRPSSAQSQRRGLTQVLQHELTQTQFAVAQHTQLPHSNPSSRRTSLNFVSPTIQSPQVPSQPFIPTFPTNAGPQIQQHLTDASAQQVLPLGTNLHHNMRRASAPNTPVLNGNPYPFHLAPSSRIESIPVDPASVRPAGPSQASQVLPSSLSTSILPGNPIFGPTPSANSPQNNPTPQIQQKDVEPTLATTVSPQDIYINPSTAMQPPPSSLVSPQPFSTQNVPPQTVPQANAMFVSSSPASTAFPQSETSMPSHLSTTPESAPKNGDIDTSTTDRPRLDGTTTQSDNVTGPQDTPISAEASAMHVDEADEEDDDDEEEEEEVELGPDGLRLVKDCLVHIFGSPVEGRVTCKLCEHRFKSGFLDKPPSPFIDATDSELEKHCIEEHQKPWEALRKP